MTTVICAADADSLPPRNRGRKGALFRQRGFCGFDADLFEQLRIRRKFGFGGGKLIGAQDVSHKVRIPGWREVCGIVAGHGAADFLKQRIYRAAIPSFLKIFADQCGSIVILAASAIQVVPMAAGAFAVIQRAPAFGLLAGINSVPYRPGRGRSLWLRRLASGRPMRGRQGSQAENCKQGEFSLHTPFTQTAMNRMPNYRIMRPWPSSKKCLGLT